MTRVTFVILAWGFCINLLLTINTNIMKYFLLSYQLFNDVMSSIDRPTYFKLILASNSRIAEWKLIKTNPEVCLWSITDETVE